MSPAPKEELDSQDLAYVKALLAKKPVDNNETLEIAVFISLSLLKSLLTKKAVFIF